jgi:hypothetical protein
MSPQVKRQEARWWSQVVFARHGKLSGYEVRIGRKIGGLSFLEYTSRPVPHRPQAEAIADALVQAFERRKPAQMVTWWTWRVVERRVRNQPKAVWVGTVRKWLWDGSYVWREISPCDTRQQAEQIAQQTVEAGQALEGSR